ncbi:MAG: hypothetical protein HQL37_04265 [Alphaproteobacteria bacterium]|nr:hypothetical protein [Alphaproteobacteria bacterium]
MSEKKSIVRLNDDGRLHLKELLRKGTIPARRLRKAQILLKADESEGGEGWSDIRIMEALNARALSDPSESPARGVPIFS